MQQAEQQETDRESSATRWAQNEGWTQPGSIDSQTCPHCCMKADEWPAFGRRFGTVEAGLSRGRVFEERSRDGRRSCYMREAAAQVPPSFLEILDLLRDVFSHAIELAPDLAVVLCHRRMLRGRQANRRLDAGDVGHCRGRRRRHLALPHRNGNQRQVFQRQPIVSAGASPLVWP